MGDRALDGLRVRLDELAAGDDSTDRRWDAHAAVLDRLAALRGQAEAEGWTSLALERDEPSGRFRLFGLPPGGGLRAEVPGSADGPPRDAGA